MIPAVLLSVIILALIIGIARHQLAPMLAVSFITAVFIPTLLIMVPNVDRFARDITGPGVSVWVFTVVALLGAAVAIVKLKPSSWFFLVAPGLSWIAIGVVFAWPRGNDVIAGAFHLGVAMAALLAGQYVGSRIDDRGTLWLTAFFAALYVFELLYSVFQLNNGAAEQFFGRTFGTFSHPAFLGKMVLLSFVFLLPQLDGATRRVRSLAWIAVVCGTLATILTQSRANTLSVALVLLVWALVLPAAAARGLRFRLLGGLTAAAAFVIPLMLDRFLADPDGGDRSELFAAGIKIIDRNLGVGTGPNRFSTVGGRTEPIIAFTGYPIHNSWLLAIGELGVVGALLFGLPIFVVILTALRKSFTKTSRVKRVEARTVVLVAAAAIAIGLSGWGMLQEPTLQIMFFTAGYAHERLRRVTTDEHTSAFEANRRAPRPTQHRSIADRHVPAAASISCCASG